MLHAISIWFLLLSAIAAFVIVGHVLWRPQKMRVMNFVWPITALYFGPFALLSYFRFGRAHPAHNGNRSKDAPFWQQVWVGATHCGAGCTLGDILAEWSVFLGGLSLAGSRLYSSFFWDFLAAYILGIIFQYFSIAPMRKMSGWPVIKAAIKADTFSLLAFEVGLFAFIYWMDHHFRPSLAPTQPEYWFLMQIGMIIGFFTSFPANWWLIRTGVKEAM
jgi:hypothetical protein